MNHELVITENELGTCFQNERDVITLSPYRIGDRVVRCSSCRTIVKSEFITSCCPVCGHSPFIPAQVITRPVEATASVLRSLNMFLWLLFISAATSLLPYAFPDISEFIYEATFGIGFYNSMLCVIAVSVIAAIITYCNSEGRRLWQNSTEGVVLLLIPVGAPYLMLAAIWTAIFAISIIIAIACMAFVVGIIACIIK